MRSFIEIIAVILLSQQCTSRPIEDTVVSVYTTNPTTMGTNTPIDVYHQIANNIAERITSPIYKFLGINDTTADETTKPVEKIELQDEHDLASTPDVKPIDNEISKNRDVEELSVDVLRRQSEKKPEKITLYSSYLPALSKDNQFTSRQVEASNGTNETTKWNEIDDSLGWDDEEVAKPKEGPFVYILELFGSLIQLVWGGLMALFKPSSN